MRPTSHRELFHEVIYPPPPQHTHASQVVRTRAADNLGELTRMSARLEQLVQDLATSGRTAEPQVGQIPCSGIPPSIYGSHATLF